jgi:hypothetical protein
MIKLLFTMLVSFTLTQICSAQVKSIQDLAGRWDITGEGPGTSLEIADSASIYLTYMGEKKKITGYTVDFSKSPYWFDFTISDSSGVVHIQSLVQVFSNNTMKWQLFLDEERSPYFTASKGEIMYLKRMSMGVAKNF